MKPKKEYLKIKKKLKKTLKIVVQVKYWGNGRKENRQQKNIQIKLTVRCSPLSHSEQERLMVLRQIFVAVSDKRPVPNFFWHSIFQNLSTNTHTKRI